LDSAATSCDTVPQEAPARVGMVSVNVTLPDAPDRVVQPAGATAPVVKAAREGGGATPTAVELATAVALYVTGTVNPAAASTASTVPLRTAAGRVKGGMVYVVACGSAPSVIAGMADCASSAVPASITGGRSYVNTSPSYATPAALTVGSHQLALASSAEPSTRCCTVSAHAPPAARVTVPPTNASGMVK